MKMSSFLCLLTEKIAGALSPPWWQYSGSCLLLPAALFWKHCQLSRRQLHYLGLGSHTPWKQEKVTTDLMLSVHLWKMHCLKKKFFRNLLLLQQTDMLVQMYSLCEKDWKKNNSIMILFHCQSCLINLFFLLFFSPIFPCIMYHISLMVPNHMCNQMKNVFLICTFALQTYHFGNQTFWQYSSQSDSQLQNRATASPFDHFKIQSHQWSSRCHTRYGG